MLRSFHGYAVEGIIEGTDGWPLALWAGALARRRWGWTVLAVGLSIAASWYLGACVLLLVGLAGLRWPRAWLGGLGAVLALPLLVMFLGAFPGGQPLDPAVRAAMGAPVGVPRPGVLPELNPFAITAYVGWLAGGLGLLALVRSERWLVWLLVPAVLSLGVGPWYELPGLELLRFPYRWHAATLAILALGLGRGVDGLGPRWQKLGWVIGPAGCGGGPPASVRVEPLIPGAAAEVPPLVASLDGPVLDVPGPVALPPGVHNPSRPRAQSFLYAQTVHGQPSVWAPDFNSVGVETVGTGALDAVRAFDRVANGGQPEGLEAGTVEKLQALGVRWVVVHRDDPGLQEEESLKAGLIAQGAVMVGEDGERWLFRLGADGGRPVDAGERSR